MMPGVDDRAEGEQEQPPPSSQSPLQSFFTLPFALHLRPLPHVSYLAHIDSQDSSETERDDGASTSSHGSNYRAGTHRLKPAVQTVPAHHLSTISTLLERTGCLDAVPIWARLLVMLDEADDDVHFVNLRSFFDTRYDSEGRLIGTEKRGSVSGAEDRQKGLFKTAGPNIFKRRGDSIQRQTSHNATLSPPLLSESLSVRRASNTSRSSDRASAAAAARSRSQTLSRLPSSNGRERAHLDAVNDDEGGSSTGEEVRSQQSAQSPSRRQRQRYSDSSLARLAPEIYVTRTTLQTDSTRGDTGEQKQKQKTSLRPVRFKVRLDLHTVKLAPRPPREPTRLVDRTSSMRRSQFATKQQQGRLASSPEKGLDMRRVTSLGSSSEHSYSGSLHLHPVNSPDSVHSRHLSDGSASEEHHPNAPGRRGTGQSDILSASPSWKSRFASKQNYIGNKSTSSRRTTTGSSVVTNATSDYGPNLDEEAWKLGHPAEERRRPSIVQRLMSFSSRKGSTGRRRSAASSSINLSGASTDDIQSNAGLESGNGPIRPAKNNNGLPPIHTANFGTSDTGMVSSPLTHDSGINPSFSMAMRNQDTLLPHFSTRTGEHSDWSNEEALDTADDEGSVGSSSGWGRSSFRRKSSAGVLPSNTASLKPVQEDGVFDDTSVFSGNDYDEADIEEELDQEGSEIWPEKSDFLSLLRSAAQTTLHLKQQQRSSSMDHDLRTPKSSGTLSDLHTPTGSVHIEEKLKAEALLAPFAQKGHEENPESWWLCGHADPLPISFACALSPALGWQGVMELCYGKQSRCDQEGTFTSLGKAAEMNDKLQSDSEKVRNWARTVLSNDSEGHPAVAEELEERPEKGEIEGAGSVIVGPPSTDVAPSESASAQGRTYDKKDKLGKLSQWLKMMPGKSEWNELGDDPSAPSRTLVLEGNNSKEAEGDKRTWQDWADLMRSIAAWMEEYETCRVRNGMARELDREASKAGESTPSNRDSGHVETPSAVETGSTLEPKVVYSSMASYKVPRCVIRDALQANNGFRRRHGIPEGLPVGPDGEEHGSYRWARSKLTSSHFTTPLLLGVGSLSYFFGQLASSDWTFTSSWELDYLEMCVFHSDIISTRFPLPSTSIVPFDQVYQPSKEDIAGHKRVKTCPLPRGSVWHASDWQQWLCNVQGGMILVPAVSWQAWWTLIAILNGADGTGRALDLQVKAVEESFEALDDPDCIYI